MYKEGQCEVGLLNWEGKHIFSIEGPHKEKHMHLSHAKQVFCCKINNAILGL